MDPAGLGYLQSDHPSSAYQGRDFSRFRTMFEPVHNLKREWTRPDSNQQPTDYESAVWRFTGRISLRLNLPKPLYNKALSNKWQFYRVLQKTGKKHVSWHTYGILFYSHKIHVRPYQSRLSILSYTIYGA